MGRRTSERHSFWTEVRMASQPHQFASRMSRIVFFIILWSTLPSLAAAQSEVPGPETQKCAALTTLNLEGTPGGPAVITSARLVDVPTSGLEQWFVIPSGYGSTSTRIAGNMPQYSELAVYVARRTRLLRDNRSDSRGRAPVSARNDE